MLKLDIEENKSHAIDFQEKYLQNLIYARDEIINSGIKVTIRKKTRHLYVSKSNKKFLQNRLTNKTLRLLMRIKPKQQRKVISLLKRKFPSLHNQKTKIYQFLKYIFITKGYNQLDTIEKQLFYNNLKIHSCIYCNRNYIFNINENGHIKGHIDHFYPKGKYPYFAMSFYNFIPVCESCNKVKHEYDTTDESKILIHPYERKNEKIFSIEINSVDDFYYQIKNDDLLKELYIEKIYNIGHKDILEDLYIKFFQQDTKEHFNILKNEFKSLGFNEKDIYRYLTNGYLEDKEFHKRSFSKVISDILENEFKII